MTENNNANSELTKKHWTSYCGGCGSSTFWGILFIVVGIFWLGKKANWFSAEVLSMFWPVLFIAAGIWIIGKAATKRRKS